MGGIELKGVEMCTSNRRLSCGKELIWGERGIINELGNAT